MRVLAQTLLDKWIIALIGCNQDVHNPSLRFALPLLPSLPSPSLPRRIRGCCASLSSQVSGPYNVDRPYMTARSPLLLVKGCDAKLPFVCSNNLKPPTPPPAPDIEQLSAVVTFT